MRHRSVVVVAVLLLASGSARAQEVTGDPDRWGFVVAPYFLAPHMNGTAGIHGLSAEVDAGPGDVFDKLKFGAMLYAEAQNRNWAIAIDVQFMHLAQEGTTRLGTVQVDFKQTGILFAGYRRVAPWAEAMLGGAVIALSGSLEGQGALGVDESQDLTWFDPLVGGRLTAPGTGRWRLALQGHVGGFGVSSDFVWQIYPMVGYRLSPLFEAALAYRAIGIDYTSGSGNEEFIYDLTTFGPEIGARFHF